MFTADDIGPLSRANEIQVWQAVKTICTDYLNEYPTTLDQDIELLKDDSLTFNQRNCVLFRSGEKEILVYFIEFADLCLSLLDMKFKDAK